ncbi:MAG: UvrB/UvrC motif-containing protein [Planctomycetes bacterium]|nr:UvrB/UvrC motif-containing protein [Planctomycetota bacterium]
MECEDCPHDKSVQLTKIVQGKLTKAVVCGECPKRDPLAGSESAPGSFSLHTFLAGIKPPKAAPEPVVPTPVVPDCPHCSITFDEFRLSGRLGCHHDYEVFRPALLPLIAKIQHATSHTGQVPARAAHRLAREARLAAFNERLADAVANERYEEAAVVRDEIQAFEAENA